MQRATNCEIPGIGDSIRFELIAYELPGDEGGGLYLTGAYGRAKNDDLIDNYRTLGPWMLTSKLERTQIDLDFRGPQHAD